MEWVGVWVISLECPYEALWWILSKRNPFHSCHSVSTKKILCQIAFDEALHMMGWLWRFLIHPVFEISLSTHQISLFWIHNESYHNADTHRANWSVQSTNMTLKGYIKCRYPRVSVSIVFMWVLPCPGKRANLLENPQSDSLQVLLHAAIDWDMWVNHNNCLHRSNKLFFSWGTALVLSFNKLNNGVPQL